MFSWSHFHLSFRGINAGKPNRNVLPKQGMKLRQVKAAGVPVIAGAIDHIGKVGGKRKKRGQSQKYGRYNLVKNGVHLKSHKIYNGA